MSRHRAPTPSLTHVALKSLRRLLRLPRLRRPRTVRAAIVTSAAAVVVLLGAGIAIAAWTSSGSGTASAKAGTALPPTTGDIGTAAFTSTTLYPGGTGDVQLVVKNPNPYPVKVVSVAPLPEPITTSGATGKCADHGVTFAAPTHQITAGNAIAAGGSVTLTLPGAVTMDAGAENGCQGALFAIPVTVTVVSA